MTKCECCKAEIPYGVDCNYEIKGVVKLTVCKSCIRKIDDKVYEIGDRATKEMKNFVESLLNT